MSNEQTSKGSKKGIFIGIILLLVILNGIQYYINISHKGEIEQKTIFIDNVNKEFGELKVVKGQLDAKLDSLDFSNSQMKFELESKAVEIEEKAKEIKALMSKQKRNLSEIASLKEKIGEFKLLLNERDEQISALIQENKELKVENEALNTQVATLDKDVKSLKAQKEDLFVKGSRLHAENIVLTAINRSGKERQGAYFRVRQLERLKLCFNVSENEIATHGDKSVYIRVTDPSGACLPQTNGTNVFEAEGSQILYSMKQSFKFENKGEEVCITWKNEQGFKPGEHTIILYSDGNKIGEEKMMVKKNLF